jgi:hypothetical protein
VNHLADLMRQRGVSCFQCEHLRPLSLWSFQSRAFRAVYGKCAACPQVVERMKAETPLMYAAHARLYPSSYVGCGPEGARFSPAVTLLTRAAQAFARCFA